jgi:putative FmdB family regulatory protein
VPIYQYELIDGSCKACGGRFELNRPMSRPPLEKCPLCRKPVRMVFSRFATPKVSKAPSVSEAKSAGFTVYKKRDQGVYERE